MKHKTPLLPLLFALIFSACSKKGELFPEDLSSLEV
jgi:hypothetical protein